MAEPKLYDNLTVTRTKDSEAELTAEIPVAVLKAYAEEVIREAREGMELPGFRKGQVPEEMVRKQLNEMRVLEDAADMVLREAYPEIIEEQKLEVITAPHVTITKLAPGNPVAFKARVGLVPHFALPDYKKIGASVSARKEASAATDEEVDATIKNIQRMRMGPAGEGKEATLPELTDEYAKQLGHFESVLDLRTKIRAGITEEKSSEAKRKIREDIAAKLIEEAAITLPPLLVEEEVTVLRNQRYEELKRMSASLEDYLKQVGKTEEQLEADERAYVERQIKTRLLLEKIAEAEKIIPDPKVVEANVEYMAGQNPDADVARVRRYVENMLTNEKVLELLEGTKPAS